LVHAWARSNKRWSFNPRARAGRDQTLQARLDEAVVVSIHAPVRGATIANRTCSPSELKVSIHAPVRGATIVPYAGVVLAARFNPRARAGRDVIGRYGSWRRPPVSIHAPVRGATR